MLRRSPLKRRSQRKRNGVRILPRVPVAAVKVFRDGREVCNTKTKAGRAEYRRRVEVMWKRQGGKCGLQIHPHCPIYLRLEDATFEHEDGRGMAGSRRDDRAEKDGKPYNLAACFLCNSLKGGVRLSKLKPTTQEELHDR